VGGLHCASSRHQNRRGGTSAAATQAQKIIHRPGDPVNRQQEWPNIGNLPARNFTCGYSDCGREVSSEKGWVHSGGSPGPDGWIYTCPVCRRPTFFDVPNDMQLPGVSLGDPVKSLPPEIETIWSEIRRSTSQESHTSAVLLGRKLLMHIAVNSGAKSGASFVDYVDYLVANHYAPPNSEPWIDKIRSHGNEANHQIVIKSKADAEEIMVFLEMLLKFIYEFPAMAGIKAPASSAGQ
jgi:Domain of unknown function (DUF4145)